MFIIKKSFIVTLTTLIVLVVFIGCTKNKIQETKSIPVNDQKSTETKKIDKTGEITSFIVDDPNTKIFFPEEYTIKQSEEKNRRGSYISYNFNSKINKLPQLYEIQFFSEKSIAYFTKDCGVESPCFYGDFPNTERYFGQKKALQDQRNYTQKFNNNYEKEFTLQKFNDPYFFVSFNGSPNGDIYEYSTFIDNVKIDIWIFVEDENQKSQSDALFSKLKIVELDVEKPKVSQEPKQKTPAVDIPGTVWVEVDPVQCLGNAWEVDWLRENNNDYDNYPRGHILVIEDEEEEIIKEYYKKQGINILYIKSVEYSGDLIVCEACSCAQGYTLYLQISNANLDKMLNLGYKLYKVPNLNCEDYHYSNCPKGCQKQCRSSDCTPDGTCTDDCDGPESCVKLYPG